jgi:hypothetical protein
MRNEGQHDREKTVIIKQFLQNAPTSVIARRPAQSDEACDRYIKAFKQVQKLFEDVYPEEYKYRVPKEEKKETKGGLKKGPP